MKKVFSIIIPFYNGDFFYSKLLQSINLAIKNCENSDAFFEIITIIDSIETNIDSINHYCKNIFAEVKNVNTINLKNDKNLGVAATRNKAIKISTGDYLHLIDQDDEVTPDFYFISLIHLLENNFLLFNGKMIYTNKNFNNHKIFYLAPKLSIESLIKDDFIRSPGQVIFSKSLLHKNLFPEPIYYKGADDRFFWLRLFIENINYIKAKYINNPCYIANIHTSNYSNNRENLDNSCLENWSIFCAELDVNKYSRIIFNDILRVSYRLKKPLPLFKRAKGFFLHLNFNLKLSKLIRFIIKRLI
jgi:glycosyltransferase involved in cell wall biosynthesis